jgi:hypothetical protein
VLVVLEELPALDVPKKEIVCPSVVPGLQVEMLRNPVTGGRISHHRSGPSGLQVPMLGKEELEAPKRDLK